MTTVIGVSFKRAGKMYYFDPNGLEWHIGDKAIVETARGMEGGDVVTEVKEVEDDEVVQPLKTVIRAATEEDLKKIFRRNGFDQLDVIVEYFMKNLERFPEFETSDYYISGQHEVIPDRFVFSKFYKTISHVVFKHLQPFIHRVIDLDISPIITINETVLQDTNLLQLIRPIVVYLAVAYAIEDSGVNIDETGVWLENKIPADGIIERNPLSKETSDALVTRYRELASRYMDRLTKEVSGVSENINVFARDNKNKKTIWI